MSTGASGGAEARLPVQSRIGGRLCHSAPIALAHDTVFRKGTRREQIMLFLLVWRRAASQPAVVPQNPGTVELRGDGIAPASANRVAATMSFRRVLLSLTREMRNFCTLCHNAPAHSPLRGDAARCYFIPTNDQRRCLARLRYVADMGSGPGWFRCCCSNRSYCRRSRISPFNGPP